LGLSKADAFTSPVFLDEVDACGFEGPADRGLVRESNRDFPVDNLSSTDGCYPNF
jgi:hypothetical protein